VAVLESANAAANAIVMSFMFSPSLLAKQQMELPSDHSSKSPAEILREAATYGEACSPDGGASESREGAADGAIRGRCPVETIALDCATRRASARPVGFIQATNSIVEAGGSSWQQKTESTYNLEPDSSVSASILQKNRRRRRSR
jgi:hypothetical protein